MTNRYEATIEAIEETAIAQDKNKLKKSTHQQNYSPRTEPTKTYKDERENNQIIRLSELTKLLSISRSCVYDWLNPRSPRYDPSFPKQIRLSGRVSGGAVGWRLTSIRSWLDSRDQPR